MKKRASILLIFIFQFSFSLLAQDDLMKMLEEETPTEKEYVTATFKGTRLINLHTIEVPGKRTLEFRISHHFGDINGGGYQFFGLDGGASIRMALEYSIDGRLELGVGRNSQDKMYDGFAKYKLLRQTTDNSMPVSLTLLSGIYYTSIKDPNKAITGIDRYQHSTSRFAYCSQLIFARKFTPKLSIQLAPTITHYNLVDAIGDENDIYSLAFASRYKLTKRAAVNFEYVYNINEFSVQPYYNSVGIGFELETGGHVFQMFVTNSSGMAEPQFIGRTTTKWQDLGLKIGFNISRMFSFSH